MDSHRKGDLTEAVVIAELKRRCIPVSLPFGDNERYDLIIETPAEELLRVQVKTGWLSVGKVQFHAKSQHTNSQGNTYKPYDDDVDLFLVYCHEIDMLYLVQADVFEGSISLRVEEPKIENRRINWAHEFEFDRRWPPDKNQEERTVSQRESIGRVIELLMDGDITVAKPTDTNRYQLIIEEPDGNLRRMRVKSGWLDDGRIRYAHEQIPERIDYLGVYVPRTDNFYIVPRRQFDSSITLRVDEPKKPDSRINWAVEYEYPAKVP